jgi:hypothetical protein
MGVPNTTTFTLQNVVDEVNPTTDDLVDCFSDSTASRFNSSYNPNAYGTDNNLLNFRDYTDALTSFSSSSGQGTTTGICTAEMLSLYYHTGSGSIPVSGDTCYSNSGGTTVLPPNFYRIAAYSYMKIIDSSGTVALIFPCDQ